MVPWYMEVWFETKLCILLHIMCELLDS